MKKLHYLFICYLFIINCDAQRFDLASEKFEVGDIFIAYLIYDLDKWNIREENKLILDSLVILMKQNTNLIMEVGTHTNKINPALSMRLDSRRSKSVVDYMISNGISISRLIPKGYGDQKPLIKHEDIEKINSEEERIKAMAMNRRTEFKILKIDFED
ncbi:MAG: OmpA family protein [Bacteroidota bacterium]